MTNCQNCDRKNDHVITLREPCRVTSPGAEKGLVLLYVDSCFSSSECSIFLSHCGGQGHVVCSLFRWWFCLAVKVVFCSFLVGLFNIKM